MSNFYYCNDCRKAVDLKESQKQYDLWTDYKRACNECGGTNWEAKIDNDKHVV